MAKAAFHKGQRVFVKPMGTYALVEQVLPHWVKGVEEPLKIHYDVGFGRDFSAHELVADVEQPREIATSEDARWRILRMRSRWEFGNAAQKNPSNKTFPVIVTDALDWGGWRVPKAEFDRDPDKIEFQALVMVNAMELLRVARDLVAFAEEAGPKAPAGLGIVAGKAQAVLQSIYRSPGAPPEAPAEDDVSPQLRRLSLRD
jgi:hypothetical protein